MVKARLRVIVVGWLALTGRVCADNLAVDIVDESGRPEANAVISLVPADQTLPVVNVGPAGAKIIDQHDEMFDPLVTVVQRGGSVTFTNSDKTQHHVYSFAPIKRFQFLLKPGDRSPALVFDQPGVAAIGCNIHDHMVTYVFVADTPYIVQTNASGYGVISNIPKGAYRARAWHPDMKPGKAPAQAMVEVGPGARLRMVVPILPKSMTSMHEMRGY